MLLICASAIPRVFSFSNLLNPFLVPWFSLGTIARCSTATPCACLLLFLKVTQPGWLSGQKNTKVISVDRTWVFWTQKICPGSGRVIWCLGGMLHLLDCWRYLTLFLHLLPFSSAVWMFCWLGSSCSDDAGKSISRTLPAIGPAMATYTLIGQSRTLQTSHPPVELIIMITVPMTVEPVSYLSPVQHKDPPLSGGEACKIVFIV